MKNLLLAILVSIGVLVFIGTVSAATPVSTLQPASNITYNEEVVINDTLKVNSVQIGSTTAGVGGVTYFNGSIVNAAVDEDGNSTIAVTIADDLRVDGEIYRTEVGGTTPLKIADALRPQTDNVYRLGESNYQWSEVYAGIGYFTDIEGEGIIDADNLAADSVGGLEIIDGTITGSDIDADSNLSLSSVSVDDRFVGRGAAKAMVEVEGGIGDCTIAAFWTYDDSDITCSGSQGSYEVSFNSSSFNFNSTSDKYYLSVTVEPITTGPTPKPYLSGSYYSASNVVKTMITDENIMSVPSNYQIIIY